jgi:branched-chain amino acid transport system substrate-binding protein
VQSSRAKVIGLANDGSDGINCIKQAVEFGAARRGTKLAALVMLLPDVHAPGLETAQGLICTESFYWDLIDRTRAFSSRLRPQIGNAAICMD